MVIKPNDFYIGSLSFFAVMLPGMIGVYFLNQILVKATADTYLHISNNNSFTNWIVFFILSYSLGHIIYLWVYPDFPTRI